MLQRVVKPGMKPCVDLPGDRLELPHAEGRKALHCRGGQRPNPGTRVEQPHPPRSRRDERRGDHPRDGGRGEELAEPGPVLRVLRLGGSQPKMLGAIGGTITEGWHPPILPKPAVATRSLLSTGRSASLASSSRSIAHLLLA